MRIFYLDEHPRKAARMMVDHHVGKACVQFVQLLSTCWWIEDYEYAKEQGLPEGIPTHPDVPFLMASMHSYVWLYRAWEECLLMFYEITGIEHYAQRHREALMKLPPSLSKEPVPYFPHHLPEALLINDEVESSRLAYQFDAARFPVWTGRETPSWWTFPEEVH